MESNIKYFSKYALVKKNKLISRAIRESLRKIDAIKAENNHTEIKYKEKSKLIDIGAMKYFTNRQSISSIKYCYGFNHYAAREKTINRGLASKEYSQCSKRETWCHVV